MAYNGRWYQLVVAIHTHAAYIATGVG